MCKEFWLINDILEDRWESRYELHLEILDRLRSTSRLQYTYLQQLLEKSAGKLKRLATIREKLVVDIKLEGVMSKIDDYEDKSEKLIQRQTDIEKQYRTELKRYEAIEKAIYEFCNSVSTFTEKDGEEVTYKFEKAVRWL